MEQIIIILNQFFQWVLTTSAMASVMVGLILLAKFILKDKINTRWHYLLWILVIARLILPWTLESSFSVFNLVDIENPSIEVDQQITFSAPHQTADPILSSNALENETETTFAEQFKQQTAAAENQNVSLVSFIMLVWLLGVFCLFAYIYVSNKRFAGKVNSGTLITDPRILQIFGQCKNSMRIRKKIYLIKTSVINSPTLYSSIRPRLLLPEKTIHTFTDNELKYIFCHELAHFKRNDIAVNWLMASLLILHWFNPILWYAYFRMREDQEMACDALALSFISPNESTEYGYTIIKLLENYSLTLATPGVANFSGNKSQLKRRIRMIRFFRKGSYKWSLLGLTVVILLTSIALTNAKSSAVELTHEEVKKALENQGLSVKYTDDVNFDGPLPHSLTFVINDKAELHVTFYKKVNELKKAKESLEQNAKEKGYVVQILEAGSTMFAYYSPEIQDIELDQKIRNAVLQLREFSLTNTKSVEEQWTYVLDLEQEKKLQQEVDNGHRPGKFDPRQVAMEFLMFDLQVKATMDNLILIDTKEGNKLARVDLENGEDAIELQLVQPVRKGEIGIWAVEKYRYLEISTESSGRSVHQPISVGDVSSIEVWGNSTGEGREKQTKENMEKIISWFNSATDIRENKDFLGSTPGSGIIIHLKSGERIVIINSGTDFEVQRNTDKGRVSYWAKQPEIEILLEKLKGKPPAAQSRKPITTQIIEGIGDWPGYRQISFTNGWVKELNGEIGEYVSVAAGAFKNDPKQGVLHVIVHGKGKDSPFLSIDDYPTPGKHGAVRILSFKDFNLVLEAEDGYRWIFNALFGEFIEIEDSKKVTKWEYTLLIAGSPVPTDGKMVVTVSDFDIRLSERQGELPDDSNEVDQAKVKGLYNEHLKILSSIPYEMQGAAGTVIDTTIYSFKDVPKGSIVELNITPDLKTRLGLNTTNIKIKID
jgi:beta-lactamase regulating signal transducer with metallopeptidase domain